MEEGVNIEVVGKRVTTSPRSSLKPTTPLTRFVNLLISLENILQFLMNLYFVVSVNRSFFRFRIGMVLLSFTTTQQRRVPQYQLVPLRVLQLDRFHSFALLFYLVLHFLDQNHRAKPLFDRLTHLVLAVHLLVLQELLVHLTYLFYLQQVFQNEFLDQLRYCQNPRSYFCLSEID